MKFLVTVKPGPMPPPAELVRQAQDWIQEKLDDGSSKPSTRSLTEAA